MLHSVLWAHYDDVNIPYLQTSNYFVFCYCKWIFLCVILAYMCQFTLGTIYSGRTARCSDKQLQHLLDRGLLGENSKLLSRVAAPTSSETNNTRKFIFLPIIKIWDALHFWNTICASLFFICIFFWLPVRLRLFWEVYWPFWFPNLECAHWQLSLFLLGYLSIIYWFLRICILWI